MKKETLQSIPPLYKATEHGPSFLRWAGSKRKSLAVLSNSYCDHTRHYVEPFAGSAALFFQLAPAHGTLGDLNGHLINALRHVRDAPAEIYERLLKLKRTSVVYYRARELFNNSARFGIESATLFIYLNRNCFNGLWRTNLAGKFNVPFGGHEMGRYPPQELFLSCAKLLKKVRIKHQDFRKTISEAGERSYIYADPPYFAASERIFVEYGKTSFGKHDLSDLVDELVQAESRGAQVALTYHDGTDIPVPSHWQRTEFEVTRNVGGFVGARKKQKEVLFTSYNFSSRC